MFELDPGKTILVAVVALVVVGPKDLPEVLRAVGQAIGRLRRLQSRVRDGMLDLVAEADLDGIGQDLASLERDFGRSIAMNPATAMRASLPAVPGASPVSAPESETVHFASPEMEAYLSPPTEPAPYDALAASAVH